MSKHHNQDYFHVRLQQSDFRLGDLFTHLGLLVPLFFIDWSVDRSGPSVRNTPFSSDNFHSRTSWTILACRIDYWRVDQSLAANERYLWLCRVPVRPWCSDWIGQGYEWGGIRTEERGMGIYLFLLLGCPTHFSFFVVHLLAILFF